MRNVSNHAYSVQVLAVLLAALMLLTGCQRLVPEAENDVCIYATVYPIYALTDAVLRDIPDVELRCLIAPQDGCLRSYELSDWDALLLRGADAVIEGGRGLETFESALFNLGSNGPAVIAALYNQELYGASANAHGGSGESDSHLDGLNPHLYMSIEGASRIIESIGAGMLAMDPDYAGLYSGNVENAMAALDALGTETRKTVGDASGHPVILMNEALIYVARDYGLMVADWIDRESGEAFYDDELNACIERLRSTQSRVILIEKQAPTGFVRALEEAGFYVARLDILSTRHEKDGFGTYQRVQRENAAALRAALDAAGQKTSNAQEATP